MGINPNIPLPTPNFGQIQEPLPDVGQENVPPSNTSTISRAQQHPGTAGPEGKNLDIPNLDPGRGGTPPGKNAWMGGSSTVGLLTALLEFVKAQVANTALQGELKAQQMKNSYAASDVEASVAKDIYDKQAAEKITEGVGKLASAAVQGIQAGYSIKQTVGTAKTMKDQVIAGAKKQMDIIDRKLADNQEARVQRATAGETPPTASSPQDKKDFLDLKSQKAQQESIIHGGADMQAHQAISGNIQIASALGGMANSIIGAIVDFQIAGLKGQEGTLEYQRIQAAQMKDVANRLQDQISKAMNDNSGDISKALQLLDKILDSAARIGTSSA